MAARAQVILAILWAALLLAGCQQGSTGSTSSEEQGAKQSEQTAPGEEVAAEQALETGGEAGEGVGETAEAVDEPPPFVDPMLEGVDPSQLVRGPSEVKKVETQDAKVERIIRQLSNYLMVEAGKGNAPADREGAAAVLLEGFEIEWPKDPWGNPYEYKVIDARTFEVYSAGADGQPGTEDDLRVTQ